jgi:hypothetical protein
LPTAVPAATAKRNVSARVMPVILTERSVSCPAIE